MAKKTKEDQLVDAIAADKQLTEEQMKDAREVMRKNLREKFDKWMVVYDEEATEEDINAAKAEFDKEIEEFRKMTYTIAEENSLEYAKMLKKWNAENNTWENGEWKGVIMFDKVITEMIETFEKDPNIPFVVDYDTLMYLYKVMSTPRGMGLNAALAMAAFEDFDVEKIEKKDNENFVTYSHILQEIVRNVKYLTNYDKKIKLMRERINIETAGIKFDWKIAELEEFIQLHNAWVCEDLPNEAQF